MGFISPNSRIQLNVYNDFIFHLLTWPQFIVLNTYYVDALSWSISCFLSFHLHNPRSFFVFSLNRMKHPKQGPNILPWKPLCFPIFNKSFMLFSFLSVPRRWLPPTPLPPPCTSTYLAHLLGMNNWVQLLHPWLSKFWGIPVKRRWQHH